MAKCGVLENLLLKEHTHTFVNTGTPCKSWAAGTCHHMFGRMFAVPCTCLASHELLILVIACLTLFWLCLASGGQCWCSSVLAIIAATVKHIVQLAGRVPDAMSATLKPHCTSPDCTEQIYCLECSSADCLLFLHLPLGLHHDVY